MTRYAEGLADLGAFIDKALGGDDGVVIDPVTGEVNRASADAYFPPARFTERTRF